MKTWRLAAAALMVWASCFAVSSHNTNRLTTATFRDFSNVMGAVANPDAASGLEPLGQCSRRTSLVISEIMFHPPNVFIGSNKAELEYIEFANTRGEPEDISGYRISGDVDYTFPTNTVIPGGGFLVVARSPADVQAVYGLPGVLGPWDGASTNGLPNSAGTVRLRHRTGAVFLEINYSDQSPWPVAADGAGHSLVLARPSYGENNPLAWAASDAIGGSPGGIDPVTPDPLRNIVINEFLAHTDFPEVDYVELYNHSSQAVDISGCIFTDDPDTNKFIIPPGTLIPPRGFAFYTETNMNFALSAEGETIYLKDPAGTRVLDAVRFDGQENGVATGRYPDGADRFYRLTGKTPRTNNAAIGVSDVVINELMYHPISEDDNDQYIELYNRSANTINLGGWTFDDAVSFTFPSNTVIAAGGYLVIANNRLQFITNYPSVNTNIILGNFSGKLSGQGERLALTKPDAVLNTNDVGVVTTNLIHIAVDEVTYGTGGRWPQWSDGGGGSLELVDPRSNHRLASNWADSDETHKAPWSLISATGTIDNGNVSANQLQVLLPGAGECLIDNVQVITNGVNLIANSTFETDASGWTAEGTESMSGLETTEGYGSSRSYHVRAVDRGDNQVNRIRTPLTVAIPSGTPNVTLRANVRWLKGNPEILLRLRGNWLECAGEMALPISPGTPGARNSRYLTNAPPAITGVQHSPVLPTANESIVVTACVHDPNGLLSVTLNYRLDPNTAYSSVAMTDSGALGDAVAGDGIFSGAIPGQATATTVAFYVEATDNFSPPATDRFPNNAPARECLVRVGEVQPAGNFPVYRIWMTQATLNAWTSRSKLNNSPLDVTFVLGDNRVIYNTKALYAGSPYIAPGYSGPASGRCGYSIEFPEDDLFLGDTDLVLDWPGGHGNETTAMQEQMAYWIADRLNLPFSHRYSIRLHVNGVTDDARHAVFEAVMQPGGSFVEAWSPDNTDGQFFKIDRAFEFSDAGGLTADPQPRLQNFTTTGGVKKREKYRWNFNYRATRRVNDYTNIFALVDALNSTAPEPYTCATFGLVDVEQWMGIFATEHIIVNFDAYGHEIGKNMYAYLPKKGKWQLYLFDLDWLMLAAPSHISSYAPSTAPLFNSEDPTIARMYAFPPFARAYWRTIQNAVNGPLAAANCNPVMDAKYNSLVANGIVWCDNQTLTDPTVVKNWFSQRRAALQAQLAAVTPAFTVNASVTISNGVALISGTAPVEVNTVSVNGAKWQVTWTSVTGWTATVPLQSGSNFFSVVGLDVHDQSIVGASNSVSVVYNGSVPSPVGSVVINEIMFNPAIPEAEYVELFNTSSNYSFDLSGWNFNGLGYDFPGGTFIGPRGYLVLAKDRAAFDTAYGAGVVVFDQFPGNLQSDGETLSLMKPGVPPAADLVVDRVRYETNAPWPTAPRNYSLQLFDATQDNSRVANWIAGTTNGSSGVPSQTLLTYSSVWRYMQTVNLDGVNWTAPAYNDASWPFGPGLLGYEPSALPEPIGTQLTVVDGRVTFYFRTSFNYTGTVAGVSLKLTPVLDDGAVVYLNGGELFRLGITNNPVVYTNFASRLIDNATYEGPFTIIPTNLVQGTNVLAVEVHQINNTSSDVVFGLKVDAEFNAATNVAGPYTPGAATLAGVTLPAFPSVWLNELQADNVTGPMDNFGQREPWVEIYNAGSNALNLAGFYLSDTYTNLAKWAFAANASITPGGLLVVWCDDQTNQTTANALHTNFRLSSGTGRVALARALGGTNQIVDYLNYANLPSNWSYGDLPDGQPFYRNAMFAVTPNATNSSASPPINVFINEWMADNLGTLADPADSDFEDWFEIYNPGTTNVDLGGYYLTDNLTNKFQYPPIPATGRYLVPPHGYLLVWADDATGQNNTNRADLHVNFKLDKDGEAVGLFAADGTTIDAVTFGAQATDMSEGRYPDGTAGIYPMTVPTPRAANFIPNTPPTLAPMSNQVIAVRHTLAFPAIASDTDAPPQTLTFSLSPGAPANASINPASGEFSWTPTNGPSTNAISIIVSDNGSPTMSATQTFIVTVYLPPTISFQLTGDAMQLSWPSGILQQADEAAGSYSDVFGAASPYVITPTAARQFYRVRF